jgi:alcohol dehydrogenase
VRDPLAEFDWTPPTRVVCGRGCVEKLGELVAAEGCARVLLVTDPGLAAAGHPQRAKESLERAGLTVALFDGVRENPTTKDVEAVRAHAADAAVDGFVALGGGSCIDAAKGADFLVTNGGKMDDYRGRAGVERPLLPLVAVPTTAGSGSEVQSFALIATEATHEKMACGDPTAAPRVALLDAELSVTMPRPVTAVTGLDAITHAVETTVTRARNERSTAYSREAFRLAARAFPRVLADAEDLDAREDMLVAAALAGVAIEASMLGAAHALANPLTRALDVPHGLAVGLLSPHVVRFNATEPATRERYAELGRLLPDPGGDTDDAVAALVGFLERCLETSGLPTALSAWDLDDDAVGPLALEAATQWTADFNPRTVTAVELAALYRSALDPTES